MNPFLLQILFLYKSSTVLHLNQQLFKFPFPFSDFVLHYNLTLFYLNLQIQGNFQVGDLLRSLYPELPWLIGFSKSVK